MGFCELSSFCFLCLVVLLFDETSGVVEDHNDDRAALLAFRNGIVSDPQNYLEDWSLYSEVHFCNWNGVQCNNASHQVVSIDLYAKSLRGTISPSLSNLSSLTILDLARNFFEGCIPKELGSLVNLQQLSLKENLLRGNIPTELKFLRKLEFIHLGSNRLEGEIPELLFCNGSNSPLVYVDLSNNSLSGRIPLNIGCELRDLEKFLLWSNKLEGEVPAALSNSTYLEWLDLSSNRLSGELPSAIVAKMPLLKSLVLSDNEFVSHEGNTNLKPFFASLFNSSYLQELELARNRLGGEIPSVIGDLHVNLSLLHLDDNLIYGSIPPNISKLRNLTVLNLSSNFLNGTIPSELCRLRKLQKFNLSNNLLSGEIPSSLGEIPGLGLIDLSRNKLSGSIPEALANLSQLRELFLYGNHLSGSIPPSLGKCTNLDTIDLSGNQISGLIPSEVAGLRSLKLYLNLSGNHLHGPIPLELSKMDMVLAVDLSSNNLSGPIPSQLGSCIALESLNLSGNSFDGPLPVSIGQLRYLQTLDVSFNQLTGSIPDTLQTSTLKQLNFSFNKFSGEVSDNGVFSWLTISSFLGNDALCGSIKGMPKCREKHKFRNLFPIILCSSATLILCITGIVLVLRSRMRIRLPLLNGRGLKEYGQQIVERKELNYPRISYRQLEEATGGFSPSSLIGSGKFGEVYKGILPDKTKIAVKVLKPIRTGGEIAGSFKRECQVLKRTRHRNLIRIITTCSRPDFKAIVLPLMSNGSLESYLYPNQRGSSIRRLDLVQLVSICSDVAEGVAYLHHHSPVRVVHCDIKPCNILLDDDMTALVTDFGISRLIIGGETNKISSYQNESTSFSSTHGLLCGSVGYIAPEYGLGERASTEGDVFSFGVLVLEVVTGKRPTDHIFQQGAGLHEWVKSHYPHKLEDMADEAMKRYGHLQPNTSRQSTTKLQCEVIFELIELGLLCTQYTPSLRPSMVDVAHEITRLKEHLSNSLSLLIREAGYAKD